MKNMEIDKLLSFTKEQFDGLSDKRASNQQYSIGDALQSGLAMFSLKDSSLLEFNNRYTDRIENLLRIYKINKCPSDSQMRLIIDQVKPVQIERVQQQVIRRAEQAGVLNTFEYFLGWKLLLIDGVEHFNSQKVNCKHCRKREHQDGRINYNHAMLGSVIAHPDLKAVLPLAEEAIRNEDGVTKNDCELNAVKRLIQKVQTRYIDQRFIYVGDALYANGPFIKAIQQKKQRFIIRVKPGSGAGHVIRQYEDLLKGKPINDPIQAYKAQRLYKKHKITRPKAEAVQLEEYWTSDDKSLYRWHYLNKLRLNEQHPDVQVNYLCYEQFDAKSGQRKKKFEWITDIKLTPYSVEKVSKAGRCRWKIENETFNTLKNQGYHFEHNYGHGQEHLCTNFALLMMLAFLIDQIQQITNELFKQILEKRGAKKYLWEDVRSFFRTLPFSSMEMIYNAILYGVKVEFLVIKTDSS